MCVKDDIGVHPSERRHWRSPFHDYFLAELFIVYGRIYSNTTHICYDYLCLIGDRLCLHKTCIFNMIHILLPTNRLTLPIGSWVCFCRGRLVQVLTMGIGSWWDTLVAYLWYCVRHKWLFVGTCAWKTTLSFTLPKDDIGVHPSMTIFLLSCLLFTAEYRVRRYTLLWLFCV